MTKGGLEGFLGVSRETIDNTSTTGQPLANWVYLERWEGGTSDKTFGDFEERGKGRLYLDLWVIVLIFVCCAVVVVRFLSNIGKPSENETRQAEILRKFNEYKEEWEEEFTEVTKRKEELEEILSQELQLKDNTALYLVLHLRYKIPKETCLDTLKLHGTNINTLEKYYADVDKKAEELAIQYFTQTLTDSLKEKAQAGENIENMNVQKDILDKIFIRK